MVEIEQRVEKLEHIMYGNGEEGVLEIVRGIRRDLATEREVRAKDREQFTDMKKKVYGLEKVAWKASGIIAAVLVAIQLVGLAVKVLM